MVHISVIVVIFKFTFGCSADLMLKFCMQVLITERINTSAVNCIHVRDTYTGYNCDSLTLSYTFKECTVISGLNVSFSFKSLIKVIW